MSVSVGYGEGIRTAAWVQDPCLVLGLGYDSRSSIESSSGQARYVVGINASRESFDL